MEGDCLSTPGAGSKNLKKNRKGEVIEKKRKEVGRIR